MCVKYDVPSCHEMGDYKTGDCLLNGEGKRTGFCLFCICWSWNPLLSYDSRDVFFYVAKLAYCGSTFFLVVGWLGDCVLGDVVEACIWRRSCEEDGRRLLLLLLGYGGAPPSSTRPSTRGWV